MLTRNAIRKSLESAVLLALWLPGSVALAASAQIYVDAAAIPGGDGSLQWPFNNIAGAVDEGRKRSPTAGIIQINVAAGEYPVASQIEIDYPLTLQGASALAFDPDGRPTGSVQAGTETKVIANSSLGDKPLFYVHPKAGAQSVAVVKVSNLLLTGSASALTAGAIKLEKAQAFVVSDLVVNGTVALTSPSIGIDVTASTGVIKRSYVSGVGSCGICVGAGTSTSPAAITIQQNRSRANGAGGLLLGGTSFPLLEVSQSLTAQVLNNDLSDNSTGKQGFGIRTLAIGTLVPSPQNSGTVTAQFNGNRIDNNRYALIVDAGFPARNKIPLSLAACADTRTFGARLTLQFNGNGVSNSKVSPALVTTTRAQVWLNAATNPIAAWQYLHGATILIQDPAASFGGFGNFQYDTPSADTFDNATGGGFCPNDVQIESLRNTVIYNGTILPSVKNF